MTFLLLRLSVSASGLGAANVSATRIKDANTRVFKSWGEITFDAPVKDG